MKPCHRQTRASFAAFALREIRHDSRGGVGRIRQPLLRARHVTRFALRRHGLPRRRTAAEIMPRAFSPGRQPGPVEPLGPIGKRRGLRFRGWLRRGGPGNLGHQLAQAFANPRRPTQRRPPAARKMLGISLAIDVPGRNESGEQHGPFDGEVAESLCFISG